VAWPRVELGQDPLVDSDVEGDLRGGVPFAIQGIQSVRDAEKCVEVGCDGIVVSNHAGRQVDGAIASLDALENIIDAGIGEKSVVMFDSGVRGASDIIKALPIGAKFVFGGRLWGVGAECHGGGGHEACDEESIGPV